MTSTQLRPKHPQQEGQVMVVTALMVLVILAGILVSIDVGRLVLGRIKLQNGIDAAALAAVSVKVDKHHFDTVWRWAIQQDAYLVRMEQVRAKLILAQAILEAKNAGGVGVPGMGGTPPVPVPGPKPGGPVAPDPREKILKEARDRFIARANTAYRRAAKLHQMDQQLLGLYEDWPRVIRKASHEAAQIAWVMNIQGFENDVGPTGVANRNLLSEDTVLAENRDGQSIGGVVYANERAGDSGLYGKTAIEVEAGIRPMTGSLGFSHLVRGLLPSYSLRVNAAAQPLATMFGDEPKMGGERYRFRHETSIGPTRGLDLGLISPHMQWHRAALMAIKGSEKGPLH